MINYKIGGCILSTIICVILLFVETWVIQISWNAVGPIFWKSAPIITYIQSLYICILLSTIGLLFRRK